MWDGLNRTGFAAKPAPGQQPWFQFLDQRTERRAVKSSLQSESSGTGSSGGRPAAGGVVRPGNSRVMVLIMAVV